MRAPGAKARARCSAAAPGLKGGSANHGGGGSACSEQELLRRVGVSQKACAENFLEAAPRREAPAPMGWDLCTPRARSPRLLQEPGGDERGGDRSERKHRPMAMAQRVPFEANVEFMSPQEEEVVKSLSDNRVNNHLRAERGEPGTRDTRAIHQRELSLRRTQGQQQGHVEGRRSPHRRQPSFPQHREARTRGGIQAGEPGISTSHDHNELEPRPR